MPGFLRGLLVIGSLAVLSSACGANLAPVLQVQNAPAPLPQGATPSPARTRDAIVRALADRHWTLDSEQGQSLMATVSSGGHTATVRIDYDANYYSITYANSSPGLKYDGQYIHRRFNHWVDRLRSSINQQLAMTAVAAPVAPAPVAPAAPAPAAPAAPGDPAAPPAEPAVPAPPPPG